jgi:cyclopropane fatty-acyl-phospholipid synthase-like methyltransferase
MAIIETPELAARNIYTDGTYFRNHPTWHAEDSLWKARQITRIIKKNKLNPSIICEIGCGSGDILRHLSIELNKGIKYCGYDISPQAIEICRKNPQNNITFYLKDLTEETGISFDLVMAMDVFEHVENYLGFLKKLKSKGQYHIFHIPLDISVQSVLRRNRITKERNILGHIHYFTKETALATLEDTGYKILDFCYTKGSLELPDRGWKANLMRIPRKLLFTANHDLAARILGGFSLLVLCD